MIFALWLLGCAPTEPTPPKEPAPTTEPTAVNGAPDAAKPAPPPDRYGLGREPDAARIAAWDRDVDPTGKSLPDGRGDVPTGEALFKQKCIACHGVNGEGGVGPQLLGPGPTGGFAEDAKAVKTVGNYWPYATTIFDYVRRAMPQSAPGSLTDDEVYALSAFLLAKNKVVGEDFVADKVSLPAVEMPGKKLFVPDDRLGTSGFR